MAGFLASVSGAAAPLTAVYERDVDGGRRPDRFRYEVNEVKAGYQASLTIHSATGQVLWEHRWAMTHHDFIDDLLVQEADTSSGGLLSVDDLVKRFFDGSLTYGATLERRKLEASDLDDSQIAFAAKQLRTTVSRLRQDILSQEANTVFSYRAEWREDLLQLVYVPAVRRFVVFARGY
jgi:hypothetical protein